MKEDMEFTVEQMQMAFANVERNGGLGYGAVIKDPGEDNMECLETAVIHFTGSVIEVTRLDDNYIRIQAPGYYMSLGTPAD